MRERPYREPGFCVVEPSRPSSQIQIRPFQRQGLTTPPARKCEEPCGSYRRRPDPYYFCLAQGGAESLIFVIAQSSLAPPVSEAHDAAHRIVRPHAMTHRVGEDRAEQPDRAAGGPLAAADTGQPSRFGFDPISGLTLGDRIHEPLDIFPRHGRNRHAAELRFNVPLNAPRVGGECRGLLCHLPACQEATGFGIGQIEVAEFSDGVCFSCSLPLGGGIGAMGNAAEDTNRLLACFLRGPGRAVAPDLMPALPPLCSSVKDGVGNARAPLAPSMKTDHGAVPEDLIRTERSHLPQPDPLLLSHLIPRRPGFAR